MRTLAWLVPLALLAAGGSALAPRPQPAPCRFIAPIDLDAHLIGDPAGPFAVVAKASSRNGAEVDLEIILPDGVAALGGSPKAKARRSEARLDLLARDRARREILIRATIGEGTSRQTRVLPLVIFDAPPPPSKGRSLRDARGEALLEFSP